MTRAELTEQVYQAIELPHKESDVVVCAVFESIVRALRSGDKVEIRGFGTFHPLCHSVRPAPVESRRLKALSRNLRVGSQGPEMVSLGDRSCLVAKDFTDFRR